MPQRTELFNRGSGWVRLNLMLREGSAAIFRRQPRQPGRLARLASAPSSDRTLYGGLNLKQVFQNLNSGAIQVSDTPVPLPGPQHILVQVQASVISAGTERSIVEFGRAGPVKKALLQRDRMGSLIDKARTDGIRTTVEAVRSRLDVPQQLGYCSAGVVLQTGDGVTEFAPGDRVVTNGPHGEIVRVSRLLAAPIPAAVDFETAAFAPLASIALAGIRLSQATLGEICVVYGLGVIGQLAVQLYRAQGCQVIGIDISQERLALAERFGAMPIHPAESDVVGAVLSLTGGGGTDAVLLTLASDSNEPIRRS